MTRLWPLGHHVNAPGRPEGTLHSRYSATLWLSMAIAVACACGASWGLHAAPSRAAAAWVVPVAWIWGIAAVSAAGLGRGRTLPLVALLALAAATRLPLVGTPALLSDDVYRYLFEGLALRHGHNPFLEPPAALPGLDDPLRALVNHPETPSAYPPLALAWFWLVAWIGRPWAVQLGAACADVVTVVVLARSGRRGSGTAALVYALHPLAALESAAGAHLEPLAVAVTAAAVVLFPTRLRAAWSLLWAGVALKALPIALFPVFLRSRPRAGAIAVGLGALVTLAIAAPVLGAGTALLDGIGAYGSAWSFNGLVFPWVEPWLGTVTRPVLIGFGAVAVAVATWRSPDPVTVWFVIGASFVLLSPTVHPWYALWVLVPALLQARWAWAVACTSSLGAYAVLCTWDPATATWTEPPWLWSLTWVPFLAAVSVDAARTVAARWTRAA